MKLIPPALVRFLSSFIVLRTGMTATCWLIALSLTAQAEAAYAAVSPSEGPAAPATGPHVLYLQQLNLWRLVSDVEREVPFLLIDGKREAATDGLRDIVDPTVASPYGNGYKLQSAELFYPAIIKVDHLAIRALSQQVSSVNRLAKSLAFRANFTSSVPIDHVYVVLEAISKSDNHRFYLHELGQLEPNHSKALSEEHIFQIGYEPLTYKFYLFTAGVEIMHTEMSSAEIDAGVADLIKHQLARASSDRPVPIIAPRPPYPEELRDKKISGQTTVTFRVTEDGRVENPQITQSSHPALAASSLATIRDWRFAPAVKAGKPVASFVSLPLDFSP